MTTPEKPCPCFIAIGDGCWGKAGNVNDAIKKAKAANRKSKDFFVYLVHPDTVVGDAGGLTSPAAQLPVLVYYTHGISRRIAEEHGLSRTELPEVEQS